MLLNKKELFQSLFDPTPEMALKRTDGSLVTLEGETDGEAHVELEKVFYCKIADFSELATAAKSEHHEQWTIKSESDIKGSVRVRCIDRGAAYILAVKREQQEVELPVTEDMFTHFRSLSDNGMIKTRYEFPITGTELKWEVDVYYEKNGTGQEAWCKVDLEVDSHAELTNQSRPEFPITFSEVISGDRDSLSDEQNEFLDGLFDTVFITRNTENDAREYADDHFDDDDDDDDTVSTEGIGDFFRDMGKSLTRGGAIKSLLKIGFSVLLSGVALAIFAIGRRSDKNKIDKFLRIEGAAVMSGPAERAAVDEMSKELDIRFGVMYRSFLLKAGAMVVRGVKIFGISTANDNTLSALSHTKSARAKDDKFPDNVVVFRKASGGLVCVDSRDKVLLWKEGKMEDLDTNFNDYIGDLFATLADKEEKASSDTEA